MKPLLNRPAGPSKKRNWWCNTHMGTSGGVTCEICGTEHKSLGCNISSDYHLFRLFGLQGVSECCGALIDDLYKEWGSDFCDEYLSDFAMNPCMDGALLYHLESVLSAALKKVSDMRSKLSSDVSKLAAIKEGLDKGEQD
jgi:hypothetical protein